MQYQYGQAAANAAQRRNMEMWNQTNFGAQRQHMEDANLSVGLMYGGGGQGSNIPGRTSYTTQWANKQSGRNGASIQANRAARSSDKVSNNA